MSRTKSIFILSHDQKTTRLIRAFDGAMSSHYSRLQVGTIQGRVRTIPALMHPDATDQDMWRVVNLAAPHGTCFDSVAVLGALDDNQAAQWAMEEFGQYANAHVVQPVSCGNAKGVQYVLDHAVTHEPRMIRPDMLRSASDRTTSEAVLWDSLTLLSHLGTSSGLMRDLSSHDWEGELLDAMTLTDLAKLATDDAEVLNFDALIVQYNKLDTLINRLTSAMAKSTVGDLKVTNVTQSKPFKKNGVAQVAVLFELSDGQTMTILLHNPDSTPAKIAPTDNLTSWKWLLNKRDVSVVVQPKQGEDVQMPVLAARMLKIATQNSARFKRTQGKRLEVEQTITDTQTRIQEKQGQLQALNNEIQALQGQIDEGLKVKSSPDEPAAVLGIGEEENQDEMTDAQKIELVNKAYRFADATDEFKLFAGGPQLEKANERKSLRIKASYDPLSTAVAMDKAAKKQGFKIEWQMFHEPDNDMVGRVYKENEEVGRISMGVDGKAMVYVGASGDTRVTTPSGIRAMFSDDDAPLMLDWLALHIERERDMNFLKSIINGTEHPMYDESRLWTTIDRVEVYNKPLADEAAATTMRILEVWERKSVQPESSPDHAYPQPTLAEPTVQQPAISPEEQALNKELERQAFMKSVNKIVKSKKPDEEKIRLLMENFKVDEGKARELLKPDFAGRIGFPDYELTSVNNKIKRLREKVDFARKHEEMAANGMDDMTISGVDIKMDKEENRLRLYFPKKPSSSVISELRSNGFVWSPTNQAWQRQLNENSLNAAKRVISLYADETGESDDTKDAFEVPNNPTPAPMPEPKPMSNPDRDYLQSVIDGKEDLSDADAVEKRLEEISERLDTPVLEAMFEKAADAFAAYAVSLEV